MVWTDLHIDRIGADRVAGCCALQKILTSISAASACVGMDRPVYRSAAELRKGMKGVSYSLVPFIAGIATNMQAKCS